MFSAFTSGARWSIPTCRDSYSSYGHLACDSCWTFWERAFGGLADRTGIVGGWPRVGGVEFNTDERGLAQATAECQESALR
jgi:hypothetical protein